MKADKRLKQNQKDMFERWQSNLSAIKFFEGIASDEDNIKAFEGIACSSQPLLPRNKVTRVIVDTEANR